MKKTFSMILVIAALIAAMVVTEVLAAPIQSSVDGKSKKTPGAQLTQNALKHQNQQQPKGKKTQVTQAVDETQVVLEIVKKNVNMRGTIAAIDETQMELTLKDDSVVTILFSTEPSVNKPKGKSKKPTTAPEVTEPVVVTLEPPTGTVVPGEETPAPSVYGLQVGMQVNVKANLMSDGTLVAVKIQVVPGKPVKAYHVGIVTEYTEGESITIETKKGETSTYTLSTATKILPKDRADELKVGSLVTIIAPRNVGGLELIASGIVVHPTALEGEPTGEPTEEPTELPTEVTTEAPTEEPTEATTEAPTEVPTEAPTD